MKFSIAFYYLALKCIKIRDEDFLLFVNVFFRFIDLIIQSFENLRKNREKKMYNYFKIRKYDDVTGNTAIC